MSWISPRIWRSEKSRFNDDEPLNCTDVYTPEVLAEIEAQGFDAIWMRGRLRELIHSEIYPELNDVYSEKRLANLKKVITDGKKIGVNVYLYFNEPLSLPREHEFWKKHPELAGEPYKEPEFEWDVISFCTSTPQFHKFFSESLNNLFCDLAGLGGVILITASEYQSHCWSHKALRKVGDAYIDRCITPMQCQNCKNRQPADIVAELVGMWKTAADSVTPSPQVWAWNWSWSMWYDQPQKEVIEKLPKDVKLMCDFERGGNRPQTVGDVFIDEYSLGYVGPSERFMGSHECAVKKSIPLCAKLQIGTTHELATVPNLPLIPNLFEKLSRIDKLGLDGLMFSWNFGNSSSVNTAAIKLFVDRPELRTNCDTFCEILASEYFYSDQRQLIVNAWKKFCAAFNEYPFSLKMLYFGPMNYAVAYPLKLQYEDRPMGPSWIVHEPFGDRLEDCMEPFAIEQICISFDKMSTLWNEGTISYRDALSKKTNQQQIEELSCSEMIGYHLTAMKNIFHFHAWRKRKMRQMGLAGQCKLNADEQSTAIMARHINVMQKALELAVQDSRLGYHQEPHTYFYTPESIKIAIAETQNSAQ